MEIIPTHESDLSMTQPEGQLATTRRQRKVRERERQRPTAALCVNDARPWLDMTVIEPRKGIGCQRDDT
jgi:hypothetical protein